MNSIQNNINTYVNDRINEAIIEYITKLHESYPNISVEDLTELWNENSDKQISTEKPPAAKKKHTKSETKSEDKPAPKKRTVKSEEKSAPTECSYIFTRGKTKGEKCTSKPKSGTDFCSRHTSDKGTAKEEKKKNVSYKRNFPSFFPNFFSWSLCVNFTMFSLYFTMFLLVNP